MEKGELIASIDTPRLCHCSRAQYNSPVSAFSPNTEQFSSGTRESWYNIGSEGTSDGHESRDFSSVLFGRVGGVCRHCAAVAGSYAGTRNSTGTLLTEEEINEANGND